VGAVLAARGELGRRVRVGWALRYVRRRGEPSQCSSPRGLGGLRTAGGGAASSCSSAAVPITCRTPTPVIRSTRCGKSIRSHFEAPVASVETTTSS
jgi:hypothetical protein